MKIIDEPKAVSMRRQMAFLTHDSPLRRLLLMTRLLTHPCAGIDGYRAARHATQSGPGRQSSVVFAEYMLVTGLIVLAVGLALYGLGVPLVQAFFLTKLFVLLPFP
jgi:hypothetical protein